MSEPKTRPLQAEVDQAVHADLGASASERWLNCAGSIRMSAGIPSSETSYTREGTAAHLLASRCLEQNVDPAAFGGVLMLGVEVDDEMVDGVTVYVEHCRTKMAQATRHWVEQRFSLASLNPPAPMYGTADFVALIGRTLHVDDLKYGAGYAVDAIGNTQLRYYALGALLKLEEELGPDLVDEIVVTIVQPRAPHAHGIVRSDNFTYDELMDFAAYLLTRAEATLDPEAPLTPGPWCRWCKAAATCPAYKEHSFAMVHVDFKPEPVIPEPETLPIETLVNIMQHAPLVEGFLANVKRYVQAMLERGEPVPGYKLVEKRAVRKWKDEDEAQRWLEEHNVARSLIEVTRLKSVAQVEKLIGKKQLPQELWEKNAGTTIAPEFDRRPGLPLPATIDFQPTDLEEQNNG